jgi:hypothetical protein
MKRILIKPREAAEIAKLHNCTPSMVYLALTGKRETQLAFDIRKTALDRGGNYVRATNKPVKGIQVGGSDEVERVNGKGGNDGTENKT